MRIIIKLFAAFRERAGKSEISLDLPDGSSVDKAFDRLVQLHPTLKPMRPYTTFARNREVVDASTILADDDELALLQPVSGGEHADKIEITQQVLSFDACVQAVEGPGFGGISTFLGTVRDNSDGKSTDHLEYEAYAEMAEEVISAIISEARSKWDIGKVAVQHRTGRLEIGDVSVVIAVSAPHRAEAFDACRYMIDELKTRVPIWKKEFGEDGEMWVGGQEPGAA